MQDAALPGRCRLQTVVSGSNHTRLEIEAHALSVQLQAAIILYSVYHVYKDRC